MFTHVPRQIHVLTYTLLDVQRFALRHTFVKTAENLIELGFSLIKILDILNIIGLSVLQT